MRSKDRIRRESEKTRQFWKLRENEFVMLPNESKVFHTIIRETLLKNRRCAFLSLSDISKETGIPESTVDFQKKKLVRRKLITLDNEHKTDCICINIEHHEIMFEEVEDFEDAEE